MERAKLVKADGTTKTIEPKDGKKFSLEEMQTLVGGFIEIVRTHDDEHYMIIDEEGKLKGKPVNFTATCLYRYGDLDVVVGDALVCPTSMID